MRTPRAPWRPARFTSYRKLLLLVLLLLISNLFSSIGFAATTSAPVSSSFNLDSREDVKAHMSFFLLKKTTQSTKNWSFAWQKIFFFYSKRPHSLAKKWNFSWKNNKKMRKKVPKRAPIPSKNWSFAWKIENRPTYEDLEKKNLDPQLHQIFKPIRKKFFFFSKKTSPPRKKMKFLGGLGDP